MRRLFTLGGDDCLVNLKFLDAGTKLTGSGRKLKNMWIIISSFLWKSFQKFALMKKGDSKSCYKISPFVIGHAEVVLVVLPKFHNKHQVEELKNNKKWLSSDQRRINYTVLFVPLFPI